MKSLFLMLSLGLVIQSAHSAELAPLLEKMATAYGGREKLEKIVAIRETGQVNAATTVGTSGPTVRTFGRPNRLKIEIGDPAKPTEIRLLNGTNGWRNGKPAAAGTSFDAMLLQAIRLDLPYQLWINQSKLTEKEPITAGDGKHLRVLELSVEKGLTVVATLDESTGHIVGYAGTTGPGGMGRMTFETAYEDFRLVDGILFAFKETNVANGTKTAETTITKVELLSTVPDVFKP